MTKILVTGNCQSMALAACMRVLAPDVEVTGAPFPAVLGRRKTKVDLDVDHIFHNGVLHEDVMATSRAAWSLLPRIVFRGYHPDMVHVTAGETPLSGPQSLLALWGFKAGLSVEATCGLFNRANYQSLGYFKTWENSRRQLLAEGRRCGMDLAPLIDEWARPGQFMQVFNYPVLRVFASLAVHALRSLGITPRFTHLDGIKAEDHSHGHWGVYPEIAEAIGCPGQYAFSLRSGDTRQLLDLRDFVEHSFTTFSRFAPDTLGVRGVKWNAIGDLISTGGAGGGRQAAAPGRRHPYAGLPDHQFWSKAVAAVEAADLDPVVSPAFTLDGSEKVATAGSCFAQHIANTLRAEGCNFLVSEPAPAGVEAERARQRGYGLFSARFGNIYTARQLLQLFDRAHGAFTPEDSVWERPDGRYADPFRPQIEPDGFASPQAVEDERERHLAAVRRMFSDLNVFIFTLGLTEGWRARSDGAVFPLAPGVAAGEMDPTRYEFVNFTAAEITADLLAFLDRLAAVNPGARVLFTVSPVPLVATYENRHVLVSTMCSKAILRAAADDVCRAVPRAAYFPSFEIITGHYNKGAYFEADLRSVTPDGVAHVMRMFTKHYLAGRQDETVELDPLFDVMCDEERLEA